MNTLRRILALARKEALAVLRDPRSRLVLVGPPFVQLVIFSFAATLEASNIRIGVLDRDGGPAAIELVQRIGGSPTFTEIVRLESPAHLRRAIDERRLLVALHIQKGFSGDLAAGRPAQIQAILDGRRANAAQIVSGYLEQIVDSLNAETAAIAVARDTTLTPRTLFNPNRLYRWFIVPALCGTLPMLIAIVITSLSVARERELGTFDQLLVSPVSATETLIGKTLPAFTLAFAEAGLMVALAIFVFGIPFTGSLAIYMACAGVFLLSAVGVGLFVSALATTQQQAILGVMMILVPAVTLSGLATPVENMPIWLQVVAEVNPLKHFLILSRGLFLKALPAEEAFRHAWPLAMIAVVMLTAAAALFRARTA